jgi:RNA polymerase sigma-70 factor, ECF subfamily
MLPEAGATGNDRTEEFLRLLSEQDRMLYGYILALVPHWADADDLAQETRVRLWQQFDKYESGTDFGAWARSVAHYLILAHREKASRSRLQFGQAFCDSIAAEFAATPNLMMLRQEALDECMEKLAPPNRVLVERHYAARQSLREMAQQMGRSYEATRKAVYRTQLALADCIESELRHKKEAGQ